MTSKLVAAAAGLLLATAAQAAPTAWKTVDRPEFTVEVPAGAQLEQTEQQTDVGTVTVNAWQLELPGGSFLAFTFTDIPGADAAPAADVLKGARQGMVQNMNADVESEREVQAPSGTAGKTWPCRRLAMRVTAQNYAADALLCIAGKRLYQVIHVAPAKAATKPEFEHVVGSFKIKKG